MSIAKTITVHIDRKVLTRFFSKITIDPNTGCWLWTGAKQANGYARMYWHPGFVLAHRLSYLLFVGDIANDVVCDHLCRVRHCVNPAHLEAVSNKENILRGIGPCADHARKTHCKNGHPLTTGNIYSRKDRLFSRECRLCHNEHERLRRQSLPLDSPQRIRQRERNREWMRKHYRRKKK